MNTVLQDKQFLDVFKNKRIHVVAPASGTTPEKMEVLRSLSLLPLEIPEKLLSNDITYHANTDETRFQLLKNALLDNAENSIVWALRGGYGSARLLDKLKALPVPQHKKTVIGFSDITALLLFLSQEWQWPVIHGSVLTQLLDPEQDNENFKRIADIISYKTVTQTIKNIEPLNNAAQCCSSLSGLITGGNLTLLENSIGTIWQAQTKEKVLFIEEVGEKAYRIDRTLYHLYQSGLFDGVKAIVLGEFLMSDSVESPLITFTLNRFAQEMESYNIPIYKTNQFGHGKHNMPFIYQSLVHISQESDRKNKFQLKMST